MLTLENIRWNLPDGEELLKGISFSVQPGKLTVITGPNGGGKTSLAKLIAGLETPSGGRILLDGQDITGWDITERAKNGIAFAFQQPVCFKGLSVQDLLETSAGSALSEERLCELLEYVGLCSQEYCGRPMDEKLSGGERKRIEIATVLARNARYLIFDEPEAGIDLWSFSSLIETFRDLKEDQKHALLIISHQERILEIADDIIVIADGKIRSEGSAETVFPELFCDEKKTICPIGKGGCNS